MISHHTSRCHLSGGGNLGGHIGILRTTGSSASISSCIALLYTRRCSGEFIQVSTLLRRMVIYYPHGLVQENDTQEGWVACEAHRPDIPAIIGGQRRDF